MTSAWSFRPPLWSIFGTAAGCSLFLVAGFWQVSRGEQKQRLLAQYAAAEQAPPVNLGAGSAANDANPIAAQAHGEYLADRQLLLDGQEHAGVAGYDVWTPLRLDDGALLIVNRGWIAASGSRKDLPPLPAPGGMQNVAGLWRNLPQPALRLGVDACADPSSTAASWPQIVEYPTVQDLRCRYGSQVLAGELLLAPVAAGGFERDWRSVPAEFPPSRHYGYAGQWFFFAATLFGLFIKLNLKRLP